MHLVQKAKLLSATGTDDPDIPRLRVNPARFATPGKHLVFLAVVPVNGDTLASKGPGKQKYPADLVYAGICRQIHGLGYCIIDMLLDCCLHADVVIR
jgi:hypothetical protein